MSMIWLVGDESEWMTEFATTLNGFFAVKRIRSIKNLVRLVKMQNETNFHRVIFVVKTTEEDDVMSHHSLLSALFRKVDPNCLFYIGDVNPLLKQLIEINKINVLQNDYDQLDICKTLRHQIANMKSPPLANPQRDVFQIADIEIDRMAATMRIMNTDVVELLTPKEVKIMQVLSTAPDFSVSREELVKRVWTGSHVSASTIDSHMSRLRKKIDQSFECTIETVYGSGWSLSMRASAK